MEREIRGARIPADQEQGRKVAGGAGAIGGFLDG